MGHLWEKLVLLQLSFFFSHPGSRTPLVMPACYPLLTPVEAMAAVSELASDPKTASGDAMDGLAHQTLAGGLLCALICPPSPLRLFVTTQNYQMGKMLFSLW